MFCKWCGADITDSATKCTRCGKDIPAMSDCGGFYDLVLNSKRVVAERVASQPAPPLTEPVRTNPIKNEETQKRSAPGNKKSSHFGNILICIGFVVIIALLVSFKGKLSDGLAQLDEINGRIDTIFTELRQIKELTKTSEENDSMPPFGEATPDEVFLEEQDAQIYISVESTKSESTVKTTADLGDYDDVVVDQVSFDKETASFSSVRIDLANAEDCIDIGIKNTLATSDHDKGTIAVVVDVEETVFAEIEGNAEYEWAYRINGSTEWTMLDEYLFTVSPNGSAVDYTVTDFIESLNDAEMIEFKLTYKRNNTRGGSLTVIISGITVTKHVLEMSYNTYI